MGAGLVLARGVQYSSGRGRSHTSVCLGDVFTDLGFGLEDAEELTAKSTLILAMKTVMAERTLTQKKTAKVCNTDQPTLSKVLHGRMESATLDRLAHWLTALWPGCRDHRQAGFHDP